MEEWKVLRYEGYSHYEVSDLGRVKGFSKGNNYYMKERKNSHGYMIMGLRKSGDRKQKMVSVHRLVAEHFLENEENKKTVNHIDGDKTNNKLSNLEWATQSENQLHAYANGLQVLTQEQISRLRGFAQAKRKEVSVKDLSNNDIQVFDSKIECAKYFGIHEKTLYNYIKSKKVHKGLYEFSYNA